MEGKKPTLNEAGCIGVARRLAHSWLDLKPFSGGGCQLISQSGSKDQLQSMLVLQGLGRRTHRTNLAGGRMSTMSDTPTASGIGSQQGFEWGPTSRTMQPRVVHCIHDSTGYVTEFGNVGHVRHVAQKYQSCHTRSRSGIKHLRHVKQLRHVRRL